MQPKIRRMVPKPEGQGPLDGIGAQTIFYDNIEIIVSSDSPTAISDGINSVLNKTLNYMHVAAPWMGRGFVVDRIARVLRNLPNFPNDVSKFLFRTPDKKDDRDRTVQAVEALYAVSSSCNALIEVKFDPDLHWKSAIVDGKLCYVSSFNPTETGIYCNHEWMCIGGDPAFVKRNDDYFEQLWANPRNITYQQLKTFYGYKPTSGDSVRRRIAEAVVSLKEKFGVDKFPKWKVVNELKARGFYDVDLAKSVLADLCEDGILCEPDDLSYAFT